MAETEALVEDALADEAADFLFGKDDYEPDPKPVVEGDESEEVEAVEETEETPEADDTPEFVEVEYGDKLYEVPTELKDALMMQSDYTSKTQEVANQRKEVEVQLGTIAQRAAQFEFAQSMQPDVLKAQQLEQTADQWHQYMRENIDQLSSTDIEKIRLQVEDARSQRDAIIQTVTTKQNEFQQAQEQSHQELLNKGTEVLRQKIPGWGEEQQKQVRDYALSHGFTEAEIGQVVDPRQVETLWKAAQYDSLKSGAAPAVKKVSQAPTIKPKSRNPMDKATGDKLNLRKKLKSTKLTDSQKAQAIGDDIASKFF